MTNAKHTPGPWKAVYSEYGEEIWFGGNDGPGMWEIEGAEAYLPGDHDEQARLIAAAPDMLEALRAIATYMRGDLTADDFKAFGLKRGDLTGNVRRIAETVLTRIDGEAAQ